MLDCSLVENLLLSKLALKIFGKTWLLIAGFSSCWSYCWDMKMDYGLIQSGSPNRFLRSELFYKKKWIYYTAMFLNLLGRFAWVLTISPDMVYRWIRPEFFLMIIYMIEMCRRGMWNFFRIELKHIDQCKHFQVSDSVKLPKFSEIKEIVEKNEKDNDVDDPLIFNASFNSNTFSTNEQSNIKIFNNYLNDFRIKSDAIEENTTNFYKLIKWKGY